MSPLDPKSQLPVLDLANSEAMLALLDSLDRRGGLKAVADWVRGELQPGRQIHYAGRQGPAIEHAFVADRSLWRIDQQGRPSGEAVVSPVTDETFGTSELFAVWSRPMAKEPFLVRLRTRIGSARNLSENR